MFYLVPIPIVFIAVIVKLISNRYGLKIFSILSNIIIILGILFFIYLYADYKGYNFLDIIMNWIDKVKEFISIKF